MADSGDGPSFPGPVVFNEDDPKPGYVTLFLKVPGLKINKALFGKAKPKNADIKPEFTSGLVDVQISVTDKTGSSNKFEYKKSTPEDIDPDKTTFEVEADRVILHLCKVGKGSWTEHRNYFIDPSK